MLMPGLLKPNMLLKPNVPAAPRLQAPGLRMPMPGMKAPVSLPILRLALPQGIVEGDLEVVVLIRQNGATLAESTLSRPAASPGVTDYLSVEIHRS